MFGNDVFRVVPVDFLARCNDFCVRLVKNDAYVKRDAVVVLNVRIVSCFIFGYVASNLFVFVHPAEAARKGEVFQRDAGIVRSGEGRQVES